MLLSFAPAATGAGEKEPKFLSVEWLEHGMKMIVRCEQKAAVTPRQEAQALEMLHFYEGFLSGVNLSMLIEAKSHPLRFPDPWMINIPSAAPSILKFVEENRSKIAADNTGGRVLLAWYLAKHSQRSRREDAVVEVLLENLQTSDSAPVNDPAPEAKPKPSTTPGTKAPAGQDTDPELQLRLERLRKLRGGP